MKQIINRLTPKTPWYMRLFSAVELLIAYGFISWAIDSGSWLHYGLGFVFIVLSIKLLARSFKK